jgi:hypothetical protein
MLTPPSTPSACTGLIANSQGVRYIMDSVRSSAGVAIHPLSICKRVLHFKVFSDVSTWREDAPVIRKYNSNKEVTHMLKHQAMQGNNGRGNKTWCSMFLLRSPREKKPLDRKQRGGQCRLPFQTSTRFKLDSNGKEGREWQVRENSQQLEIRVRNSVKPSLSMSRSSGIWHRVKIH